MSKPYAKSCAFFQTGGIKTFLHGMRKLSTRPAFRTLMICATVLGLAATSPQAQAQSVTTAETDAKKERSLEGDEWLLRAEAATNHPDALTDYSRHIEAFRTLIANSPIPLGMKIAVMDPDRIYTTAGISASGKRAKNIATGPAHAETAILLSILRQTGALGTADFSRAVADRLAHRVPDVFWGTDYNGGMVAKEDNPAQRVCVITPPDPDSSGLRDTAMMANLAPHALKTTPLTKAQSLDFHLYRSLGKCLDLRNTLQADGKNGAQMINHAHLAEVGGDVFAALMMARAGETRIADRIGDLRMAYIAGNGQRLTRQCAFNRDRDALTLHVFRAGIQFSEPALRATQDYIDTVGIEALQGQSIGQIRAQAARIAAENSLKPAELGALRAYMVQGEKTLNDWRKRAAEGDRGSIQRLQLVEGILNRGGDILKETAHADRLTEPFFTALESEKPVIQAWTAMMDRAQSYGGGVDGFARGLAEYRNSLRQQIERGDNVAAAEHQSTILREFVDRLVLNDYALSRMINNRYKSGHARYTKEELTHDYARYYDAPRHHDNCYPRVTPTPGRDPDYDPLFRPWP